MDEFEAVYDSTGECTHFVCKICGRRVERGIVRISSHWVDHHQGGMIIVKHPDESKVSIIII